ncbi:exodeoxyribonuclease VII large subunit [compost metagenome]
MRAQVRALSPQKTLDRGYAVVQIVGEDQAGHTVVSSPEDAPDGTALAIRVADGRFRAVSTGQGHIVDR